MWWGLAGALRSSLLGLMRRSSSGDRERVEGILDCGGECLASSRRDWLSLMAAIGTVARLGGRCERGTLNRVSRDWQSAARSGLMGCDWAKAYCCRSEGHVDIASGGWRMAVAGGLGSRCSA